MVCLYNKNGANKSPFANVSLFFFYFLGADVAPPGEGSLVPHEPIIFKLFDKFKDAPLIGLEYLVEIIHGPNVDPTYENLLTKTTLNAKDVISDVVSARHRLKYLVSNFVFDRKLSSRSEKFLFE